MTKVKFDSIVAIFTNCTREVSYHANTVQELIDDVKRDFPDLVFVQAEEGNKNKIHGVFVDPNSTNMDELAEAVNSEKVLEHYFPLLMCDNDKLLNLHPYLI